MSHDDSLDEETKAILASIESDDSKESQISKKDVKPVIKEEKDGDYDYEDKRDYEDIPEAENLDW